MRVRHPPPGRRVVPRECPGQYRAERYPLIVRIPLLTARGLHEDRAGCPSDRYPIVRDLSDPAEKLATVDKAEADLRRVVHAAGKKGLHPRDIGHRPSIERSSSRGCRRGPQPTGDAADAQLVDEESAAASARAEDRFPTTGIAQQLVI